MQEPLLQDQKESDPPNQPQSNKSLCDQLNIETQNQPSLALVGQKIVDLIRQKNPIHNHASIVTNAACLSLRLYPTQDTWDPRSTVNRIVKQYIQSEIHQNRRDAPARNDLERYNLLLALLRCGYWFQDDLLLLLVRKVPTKKLIADFLK